MRRVARHTLEGLRRHHWDCPQPAPCVGEIQELRRDHEEAFDLLRDALLRLDGSRTFNILEDCRLHHGHIVRERAEAIIGRWRDGKPAVPDPTASCLLALLPSHLTLDEKLDLVTRLRRAALDRLPRVVITIAVARSADLSAVATRAIGLMRRIEEIPLPARLVNLQHWLTAADVQALQAIAAETEHAVGVQRAASLMVHLAALARMRLPTGPRVAVRVRVTFQVPTATVRMRFHPRFWCGADTDGNADPLVRIQEMALRAPAPNGRADFAASALQLLSLADQEKLRRIAAMQGLRTERLLREVHMLTETARADMESTIYAAHEMLRDRLRGQIVSEHTAAFSTRIEIRHDDPVRTLLWRCAEPLQEVWLRHKEQRAARDPR